MSFHRTPTVSPFTIADSSGANDQDQMQQQPSKATSALRRNNDDPQTGDQQPPVASQKVLVPVVLPRNSWFNPVLDARYRPIVGAITLRQQLCIHDAILHVEAHWGRLPPWLQNFQTSADLDEIRMATFRCEARIWTCFVHKYGDTRERAEYWKLTGRYEPSKSAVKTLPYVPPKPKKKMSGVDKKSGTKKQEKMDKTQPADTTSGENKGGVKIQVEGGDGEDQHGDETEDDEDAPLQFTGSVEGGITIRILRSFMEDEVAAILLELSQQQLPTPPDSSPSSQLDYLLTSLSEEEEEEEATTLLGFIRNQPPPPPKREIQVRRASIYTHPAVDIPPPQGYTRPPYLPVIESEERSSLALTPLPSKRPHDRAKERMSAWPRLEDTDPKTWAVNAPSVPDELDQLPSSRPPARTYADDVGVYPNVLKGYFNETGEWARKKNPERNGSGKRRRLSLENDEMKGFEGVMECRTRSERKAQRA